MFAEELMGVAWVREGGYYNATIANRVWNSFRTASKFHLIARLVRLLVWNWNSAIDTGFSFGCDEGDEGEIFRVVEFSHLSCVRVHVYS